MSTMSGNFSIGHFGGIEVRLNWSLLAVFASSQLRPCPSRLCRC
jgi:hypothetical protein